MAEEKEKIAKLKDKIKQLKSELKIARELTIAYQQRSHHYEAMTSNLRKEIQGLKWLEEKNFGINTLEKDGLKL